MTFSGEDFEDKYFGTRGKYTRNEGRIKDVDNLNIAIEGNNKIFDRGINQPLYQRNHPYLEGEHYLGGHRRSPHKQRDPFIN